MAKDAMTEWQKQEEERKKRRAIQRAADTIIAIKEWKKAKVHECVMNFTCGGDSMGDWSFAFSDKNGTTIQNEKLRKFFDEEVFETSDIEFYTNSGDSYIGEEGTVTITLNEAGDNFDYCKSAQSEYRDTHTEEIEFVLTDKMIAFIKDKALMIRKDMWERKIHIAYKRDLVLTDDDEKLIEAIEASMLKQLDCFDFKDLEHEESDDSRGFEIEEGFEIKGKKIKADASCEYVYFASSEE